MPRRRPPPVWMLLLCAPLWTGCAEPLTRVQVERPEIPAELLHCQPQPEPPEALQSDADLARWIVDLADAGEDCRSRLARVRGLVAVE